MTRRNLRDADEFSRLAAEVKKQSQGREIAFYPSPGNWGDSLLNAGARQFFADHQIAFYEVSREQLAKERGRPSRGYLAVIGGGGGWNRNWYSTIDFASTVSREYDHTVVLPSSYDHDLLGEIDRERTTLYTRAAEADWSGTHFCHDMAFYITLPPPLGQSLTYPLIAFRRDKERSVGAINPDRNWDLSLLGTAETNYVELLRIVDRFDNIFTDRLHIGIAGAMLGKEVCLYDGNYGKNEAVYRASLQSQFPKVSLRKWDDPALSEITGIKPIGVPGYTA